MNSKNIAFISIGDDSNRCAELLVKSIKKTNPDCQIIQISNKNDNNVSDVNDKLIFNFKLNKFMLNRLEAQIEVVKKYGKVVFLDSDMLVNKDLTDVFNLLKKKDLVFTNRKKNFYLNNVFYNNAHKITIKFPEFTNKNTEEIMPFNGGFMAVSNLVALEKLLEIYLKLPTHFHYWYGDQISQKKIFDLQKFKILILDSNYNFTIGDLNEFNENVYVYHFKGRSKKLMKPFFDKYIGLY